MHLANSLLPKELSEARSHVLDAFANLEYAVAQAMKMADVEPGCAAAPLGQKLEILASLKPGPKMSKAKAKIIADAASKAQSLCEIRNDVVHSRMQLVAGHLNIAVYINIRAINQAYPQARVLTVEKHNHLADEAKAITDCINAWRLSDKR